MACLICGVYRRGEGPARDAAEVAAAMLNALPGRGCAGRIDLGAVSFGHRGLWQDGAEQGGCSALGLTALADARLDNRSELIDAFGLAGSERAGVGDCELILRAYHRWGEDCPPHLHGDYAFAVWDADGRSLFCARDAVGARPLYFSQGSDRRFVFASDIDSVLAAPGVEDDLDEAFVAQYLDAANPDSGATFFSAVRCLPPGHSMIVGASAERIRRWWRPEDAPAVRCGSDEDYQREFLDHYRQSVRDRLRGGGEVAAHLSGGLDSSSIAVLAARELRPSGRRLHAFCWHPPPADTLPENEAAEYRLIESVCAQEGLEPSYHSVSAEQVLATLRLDLTRSSGFGYGNTLLSEALVQRSAAELGVRMILSGWGGDEVASYSGAAHYPELLRSGRLRQLLKESRDQPGGPWRFLARQAALPLAHPDAADIVSALLRRELPRRRSPSFVHPALARRHRKRRQGAGTKRDIGVRHTQLKRLRNGHLERRIQDWAASGARAGIDYRYPLLDRRLIEFVLGLPAEQFRFGSRSRWFFRQSLKPVLPQCILEQAVKTDPARYRPLAEATSEALSLIARQLADRPEPPERAGYLDMAGLRDYLVAQAGLPDRSKRSGKILRALSFLDWQTGSVS